MIFMKNKTRNMIDAGKEILFPILTVSLTLTLYILLFYLGHFYPFDKNGNTVLMIDAQSQYISYLRYFRSLLLNGGSWIYTQGKVFGGDFLSIYTYYLASPFNFLLVFFDENNLPAFILITSMMKSVLSSLFMYLLLRSKKEKTSSAIIACSFAYAFMAYNFIYMSNFMWLDGTMILPLVILGLEKLHKREMKFLYPLSLCYALLSSWYIGAMICLFCVIYFLVLLFKEKEEKRKRIFDFILFSLAGGLMASLLWMPAFFHFDGTKVQASFPQFQIYPISTILKGFLYDSYDSVSLIRSNEGYYPLFVSLVCTILAIHFFFNKGYKIRFRLCYLSLFLFYFLLSLCSSTYTLLHFGSVPTWFPARYGFLLSFLIVLFSFLEWDKMEKESFLGFFLSSALLLLFGILITQIEDYNKNTLSLSKTTLLFTILTLSVSLLCIFFEKITKLNSKTKNIFTFALKISIVPLSLYSSYLGGKKVLDTNVEEKAFQKQETYLMDQSYQNSVNLLKNYDKSENYRMEMTFNRDGNYNAINNNPMFYGYNGLSHFSSSEKKEVESYMKKIGFQYNGYFEKYNSGSTLAMNSFLGIKYLIDKDDDSYNVYQPCFEMQEPFEEIKDITSDLSNIHYYKNDSALPLGFVTSYTDSTFVNEGTRLKEQGKIYWFDHFEYQNEIYHYLDNSIKKDIFSPIDYNVTLHGIEELNRDDEIKEYFYQGKKGDYLSITFKEPDVDFHYNMYFCVKNLNSNFSYFIDNRNVSLASYHYNGIQPIKPSYNKTHKIEVLCNKDFERDNLRIELYYENIDVLKEYTDSLKKQAANDLKKFTSFNRFGYEGTFDLQDDNSQFVFTLPNEKGISIFIDDKKMETITRFNIFAGCSLKGIQKGKHTIKIVYQDKGMTYGILFSLFGFILFLLLMFFIKKDKRKRILLKGL